jgi:hypothetical protein
MCAAARVRSAGVIDENLYDKIARGADRIG